MNKGINKSFSPYNNVNNNNQQLKFAMNFAKERQEKLRSNLPSAETKSPENLNVKKNQTFPELSDDKIKQMLKMAQRQNKKLKQKVNQNSTIEQLITEVTKENQEHQSNITDDLFPDF